MSDNAPWLSADEIRELEHAPRQPRPDLLVTIARPMRAEDVQRLRLDLEAMWTGGHSTQVISTGRDVRLFQLVEGAWRPLGESPPRPPASPPERWSDSKAPGLLLAIGAAGGTAAALLALYFGSFIP